MYNCNCGNVMYCTGIWSCIPAPKLIFNVCVTITSASTNLEDL